MCDAKEQDAANVQEWSGVGSLTPELKLQAVVSCLTRELTTELECSGMSSECSQAGISPTPGQRSLQPSLSCPEFDPRPHIVKKEPALKMSFNL